MKFSPALFFGLNVNEKLQVDLKEEKNTRTFNSGLDLRLQQTVKSDPRLTLPVTAGGSDFNVYCLFPIPTPQRGRRPRGPTAPLIHSL